MAEEITTMSFNEMESEPLTEWENEPSLKDLKENISDADIDNQTHQTDVNTWLDNMNMTGSAAPKKIKGRSSVAPKLIRKHAEWRYSSLADPFLSTDDIFTVSPKSAGDRTRAQQNGLVLNHQFSTYIDKVAFIDAFVRDAVDIGTVICEVGWETEEEEVTEELPTYEFVSSNDPATAQQYMNLLNMKQESRDMYEQYMNPGLDKAITLYAQTGQLVVANQIGTEIVTEMKETKNYPTVEVCESANILIDPSCNGNLNKAQFVGKREKSSLSELKKDGRYKNLKCILIESADPIADPDYVDSKDISTFSFKDEPRKQFVRYTYWGTWDIHDTGIAVPIIASWVNNTLILMEENPFPFKKHPFAKSVYMPVRKSMYGEPDGELLIENQQIIGATTRGMVDLMGRSANSQTGTKQGFLDVVNKRKYVNGENYEFNAQGDPQQSVYQHKYPEIPQSAYNMITIQDADAESLSGVKAFGSGLNSKALGDSVGGGRDIMDAASKRESGILKRIASGIKDIGRMFIAMNAEWLSEEEVIRITDEEFVTVRRDDLAGTFDLKLNISTAEADNAQASELSFMLQTTGNNMDQGLRNIIMSDIARLRKMPYLAKRLEEYEPKPDPLVVKEQELKIVLLEAQIAKEEALAAKHNAEAWASGFRGQKDGSQAELNIAKAETEGGKNRNLHSDSDIKDQAYLENHTGTKHRQEIEKQDNQALNAVNTEVVKANLNSQTKEKK